MSMFFEFPFRGKWGVGQSTVSFFLDIELCTRSLSHVPVDGHIQILIPVPFQTQLLDSIPTPPSLRSIV